jgi:hypothetical protein
MVHRSTAVFAYILLIFSLLACTAADTKTAASPEAKPIISQERLENTAPAVLRKDSAHTVSPKQALITQVQHTATVPSEPKSAAVLPRFTEERISPTPVAPEALQGSTDESSSTMAVPVKEENPSPAVVQPSPAPSPAKEQQPTALPDQAGSSRPEENNKPQPTTETPTSVIATAESTPMPVADPLKRQLVQGVSGTMSIDFETRAQPDNTGQPKVGAVDRYSFNLLVRDSLRFSGSITRRPRLESTILGRELQRAELSFDVNLSLIDPVDPRKEKQVSQWAGVVPIDSSGRYQLTPALVLHTRNVGALPELRDSFAGTIVCKGSEQQHLLAKLRQYSRSFGTRHVVIQSRHIDPIRFSSVKLAAGPLQSYPQTIVDGNLDYDYDTGNWYTNGITFTLPNKIKDVVTGSIKWVEDENRKQNGKGHYEFNLRFNEAMQHPVEDESTFFASAGDEELFFAVDPSMPGISGTISYVDAFKSIDRGSDEPLVVHSNVIYDLKAQNLSQTQVVNFLKLWLLLVGPVNDE